MLDNIVNTQPVPPSKLIDAGNTRRRAPRRKTKMPLVNPVIEAIVLKALAKNPIKRHQSGELARDLETYLAGGPIKSTCFPNDGRWKLRRLFGFGD